MHDLSPFAVLGVPAASEAQAVRKAYRQRVRECHPDQFQNPDDQKAAQERLVALNLAYEEALKICGAKRVGFNLISPGGGQALRGKAGGAGQLGKRTAAAEPGRP